MASLAAHIYCFARRIPKNNYLFLWMLLFSRIFNPIHSEESTTAETTTATATFTRVSTTTTTTPPPPTLNPHAVAPLTDLAHCLCDLTPDYCDVNCCCDVDCSDSDRLVFSFCVDQTILVNTQTCIQSNTVFVNNTPNQINSTVPGLFCIYTDNYKQANYYDVPALIETNEDFDGNLTQYGGYSYDLTPLNLMINSSTFYKSGDPIYTIFEIGVLGFLQLPGQSASPFCTNSPIPFLFAERSSCNSVPSGQLSTYCKQFTILDAHSYYQNFTVVPTPEGFNNTDFNETDLIPIVVNSILWCLDFSGFNHTCDFSSPPTPEYSNGTCNFAVVQVLYGIEYNGTSGITAVNVTFTFQNITQDQVPLTQTFQTIFFKAGETGSIRYSGNPGYLAMEPVMAGNLVINSSVDAAAIRLDSDRNNWMTILDQSSSIDGSCDDIIRTPVLFQNEFRSVCFVRFSLNNMADLCNETAFKVLNNLRGSDPRDRVASFGNTLVTDAGDWVPIIDNVPNLNIISSVGQCNNFPTSMNIQIIYANVGAINNPQAQIIGVKYDYIVTTILFQCKAPYCQPSTTNLLQRFPITTSVRFVDASSPAVGTYGAIPQGTVRLPNDFFYPFS